ncbi:unnamed protein product [Porites lobata]|uniref:Uncharacterized protein n=1 Tax=Porites lobata TaxID=104759 RepID=A0ABN8NJZ1_9CNID|nr:unnamed protein product [Porites lobata]
MGHDVIVEHYPELDFQRSQIQSSTTLLSVKSVRVGQHITVKAKLTNMSKQQKAGDLTLFSDEKSLELTLFEEPIKQILAIQNQKSQPTLTRDILTNSLLNLPAVNFTYNTTTKVVLKIAQKE